MEWRDVVGYEGFYEVSELGDIRRSGRILKSRSNGAYLKITLCKNGTFTQTYIHRIVAEAFIGKCPNGLQVNHRDSNKLNNNYRNLEYVSPLENTQHAIRAGRWNHKGEHNGGSAKWRKPRKGLDPQEIYRRLARLRLRSLPRCAGPLERERALEAAKREIQPS